MLHFTETVKDVKLREGNVFTGVCHSVRGRGVSLVPGPFHCVGYLEFQIPSGGLGMPGLMSLLGWVSLVPGHFWVVGMSGVVGIFVYTFGCFKF